MVWSTDTAGPLECEPCFGELTINNVSLHTPAWCATDLSALWGSFEIRGANRLIPGARGRRPYVRRVDETRYSIPMLISGYADEDGVPWGQAGPGYEDAYDDVYGSDPNIFQQGLEFNVIALQTAFSLNDPSAITSSLLNAIFRLPSGATRSSRVQVLGLKGQLGAGSLMRATLEILDVDGLLGMPGF